MIVDNIPQRFKTRFPQVPRSVVWVLTRCSDIVSSQSCLSCHHCFIHVVVPSFKAVFTTFIIPPISREHRLGRAPAHFCHYTRTETARSRRRIPMSRRISSASLALLLSPGTICLHRLLQLSKLAWAQITVSDDEGPCKDQIASRIASNNN